MRSDAHKHDRWCESLSDDELDEFIRDRRRMVWETEHNLQREQFKLDRLIREKGRRGVDTTTAPIPAHVQIDIDGEDIVRFK